MNLASPGACRISLHRGVEEARNNAARIPRGFSNFHEFNKHVFSGATFIVAAGFRSLLRPAV
jgi:hypothetical protein